MAFGFADGGARVELEGGGYHALGIKKVVVGAVPNTNPKGDMKIATLMANAYYDFHNSTRFTPYIGGGVGAARIGFPENNGFANTHSTDNRFAYQGMMGVSYTPESLPSTDWSVGYRYLGTTAPTFKSATGSISADALKTSSLELDLKYHF